MRTKQFETIAAIDLGSNSFHMIVARIQDGQLIVVDRLREMVRLAAGMDKDRQIHPDAKARALECLGRFGQRVRSMPAGSVRTVGTNTLRSARNAGDFLDTAEDALGHPIEVVSGIEEARLIYLGVAHSLADDGARRLVVDIGGGSTEFIIGEAFEPSSMDSLHMGCVTMTERFFKDGKISNGRFRKAELAARQELEPLEAGYGSGSWSRAVGASGTILSINRVSSENGFDDRGITLAGLERLREEVVKAGSFGSLKLKGLSDDRIPIFPGGLAILIGAFKALRIERMDTSDGAMREGLLYDLIGRISHEDVRARSVAALASRYHVDGVQARRVAKTALDLLAQMASQWDLQGVDGESLLDWASQLHEIGLDISHSQYHKHGEYVVRNADLAGFSREEQRLLATLVRAHRRKYPVAVFKALPERDCEVARHLAVLLRLSVVLHRSRGADEPPPMHIEGRQDEMVLSFPRGWLEQNPLAAMDLKQEREYLAAGGFKLALE